MILGLGLVLAFPGLVAGTHSFFYRDFGTLAYPFVHYHRECFWRGELPLWNPLSNCGVPFLAQWNTLVLYPGSLVYLLLPLPWSLSLFCLLHLLLGGLGMGWLARRWLGHGPAATVVAVAYTFGGVTLSSHVYPNYMVTLGWMPWVIGLAEKAWREGGRWILLAAAAGALQMLSGAPELILQTWLLAGALWLVECVRITALGRDLDGREVSLPPFIVGLRFPIVVTLVAGLTAVQLGPFLELLAHSQRGPEYGGQLWSMPGWGWANFLVPLFHCFRTPQGVWVQAGQAFLGTYYLGVAVIALAMLGAWQSAKPRVAVLTALGFLGAILALGENGWLYSGLRGVLPWVGIARFPIKLVYLVSFVAPLLAGYGLTYLAQAREARPRRLAWQLVGLNAALLLAIGGLAWFAQRFPWVGEDTAAVWRSAASSGAFLVGILAVIWVAAWPSRVAQAVVLALLWLDLRTSVPHVAPVIQSSAYAMPLPPLDPKPQAGGPRVMITAQAERLLHTRTLPDFTMDFLGSRLALWSNLNVLEGIPKVGGAATLLVRAEAEIEAILYGSPVREYPRWLDFLGVSHLSSPDNPVEWVRRNGFLPLVTAGQRPVFAKPRAILEALFSPEFNPRETVFLSEEAQPLITATNKCAARLSEVRFRANRVEFELEAPAPTLAVVAQTFYPAWHARVDGQPARLWTANYAFQAVEVPSGQHRVQLTYEDPWLRRGLWVSLATLGGCAAWWWRCVNLNRRRVVQAVPDSDERA